MSTSMLKRGLPIWSCKIHRILTVRIFYNCRIYNGIESDVGRIGVDCNNAFRRLLNLYKIEEKYENSQNDLKPEEPQVVKQAPAPKQVAPVVQEMPVV